MLYPGSTDSLAIQIVIDILTEEMSLDPQRIWVEDQNHAIPPDKGMFIVVGMHDAKVMSNTSYMVAETVNSVTTQHQISQVQQREDIQIDILSRSNEAIFRNWEIVAALQSFYSQQQQELYNFKIFRIPASVVKTSGAEGGSNINRFTITISAFVWYKKDTLLASPLGDYYDDFTTRVDDDVTIGTDNPIAEFEITPDSPPPP